MAGSIRESGFAERTPALPAATAAPRAERRWIVLRRAARARLAPVGAAVVLLAVLAAVLAPLVLSPQSPHAEPRQYPRAPGPGPSAGHRQCGPRRALARDLGHAYLAGGRLRVGDDGAGGGSLLGLLAGYWGGRADSLVMRLMDAVLSFPPLVLALALGAVLGAGLTGVLIALSVVYTPAFARLMRGQVLSIKSRDYVEAARALGASGWRIAGRHVLPNAAAAIVVQAGLSVAFAILAEASLSFLGLGIQPPAASWGSMINAGRGYLQQAPWIVFGPGAALFVTVVGLNFVGDALRDALDPRARF
jgi:peptide/nickel transport system permease protein